MKSAACLSAIYLPVRVLAGNFNKQSSGTHKRLFFLVLLIASVAFCPTAKAQQASGMTGVVTDSSGSVVPNAVVVLRNRTIGLRFTQTTNPSGVYRFSQIPPGQGYEAVFSAPSFSPLTVRDIYLTISNIRTQNATLSPGANLEVEVTASSSEVTIDTTDATIGNTFDVRLLNQLPVQQRDSPLALFTMQPGVTDTASVTGARSDQNNVTLDGLDVNDFATGGSTQDNSGITQQFSIVGNAPVDAVEEFRGTVAGLGAASGTSSGGQFQMVTKSGTNTFHGNINEYHRDPSLVANTWFGNNATPQTPRAHLIQNQFGGNFGGPIIIPHLYNGKDRTFFFFDYYNSKIISSTNQQRIVPLDNLRNGNVGYINSSGGTSYLSPAQVAAFDPKVVGGGEDMAWIAAFSARFPHSNTPAGGDGINSGGFTFNSPNTNDETDYVGRVDYNVTDRMKVFARFSIVRQNATHFANQFPGDPPTSQQVDRTYSFVIGHNWTIGSNKTNQAFLGETVQKLSFPIAFNPAGSSWFAFADGTGPALASTLYLQPNSQARRVPIPVVGDDFAWQKGKNTIQIGGTFKDILSHSTNVADYNSVQIGMGGQTLGLCGPVTTTNLTPCGLTGATPNPSLRPSDLNLSTALGSTAKYDYDQAFAFILGRVGEISEDFNYNAAGTALPQLTGDQRFYRYYETQLYASDTWKLLPSLTVTYGLTYQLFSVPYETHGLETTVTTTFNKYFNARVAQSAAGLTGASAVPIINYILGGQANNGPPLYQPEHHDVAPHFGFAWNPGFDKKMVFNGGAGIVYDRTIINAVQFLQDGYSYLFQQTEPVDEGIPGDPYNSIKSDPRLDSHNDISNAFQAAPATPKPPYAPFVTGGVPNGLQLGSAFNETIDPGLETPYSIVFNAGIQHELPKDMVLKISYAGRMGRRLLAQADANQILDFKDPVSGQLLSQAFAAITTESRSGAATVTQPWFENVMKAGTGVSHGFTSNTDYVANGGSSSGLVFNGDFGDFVQFLSHYVPLNVGSAAQFSENTFHYNGGFSTYHALLLTLQKNLSHGVQFDFNYTYSHSIDNISFFANSQGDTGIGGIGLICDVVHPRECRGDSDFDVRNYITADATYQLPFGRKRMFLATVPIWANEIIGGWNVSGVTTFHTGQAFGNVCNAFVASYSNNASGVFVGKKSDVATHLTKLPGGGVNVFKAVVPTSAQPFFAPQAANAYIGPVGFAIGPRNNLHGPHYFNADLGLAKVFPIVGEKVNMTFRADAFNALNHPNFVLPEENVFNGFDQQDIQNPTFGQISFTQAEPGNENSGARVLQLSLRLEF
jgi:hypothetical protein